MTRREALGEMIETVDEVYKSVQYRERKLRSTLRIPQTPKLQTAERDAWSTMR